MLLGMVTVSPVFHSMESRPRNVNATQGDTVTISCKVAAEPRASVVWFRNGEPLGGVFILSLYYSTQFNGSVL